MTLAHRRHDLSDTAWNFIAPHLPGQIGHSGRTAADNRRFLNAVFWIHRTGAPWRDLPPDYGDWKNTHRRFTRWRALKGTRFRMGPGGEIEMYGKDCLKFSEMFHNLMES
jgi:transposase